jgi:hypothetical protein
MPLPRPLPIVTALALALVLPACDMVGNVKDAFAHSQAAASSIEKAVGKKPEVGFNYNNGAFTQVTVQFADAPQKPLAELEPIVRSAVVREFKDEPMVLVIAFAYPKSK